jgi:hypothetical protein
MSFQIPQEYSDFVSDKQSLLKEIKLKPDVDNDVCVMQIFFTEDLDYPSMVIKRNKLQQQLNDLISPPNFPPYLWHRGRELELMIGKSNFDRNGWFLCGAIQYGDYIEDEWFLTYLAMRISEANHDAMVRVADNDGEFLLIEAADYLDDWMTPETSSNRVWIIGGDVYILPIAMNESLSLESFSLAACVPLLRLQFRDESFRASLQIQRAIRSKTVDVFPQKLNVIDHHIATIVPLWLASLLKSNSAIVGKSVAALSSIAVGDIAKRVQNVDFAGNDELVSISIRMTKAQYAQMTFKQFKTPRKYHPQMRRMSESNSTKVAKAFDLGCRLLCGVELLVANARSKLQSRNEFQERLETELNSFMKSQAFAYSPSASEHTIFFPNNCGLNGEISCEEFERIFDCKLPSILENVSQALLLCNKDIPRDNELFDSIKSGALQWDSDDWMFLTPDEFDKRMNLAMESKVVPPSSEPSKQNGEDNLQSIVDGFKSFLLDKSEIHGVTPTKVSSSSIRSKTTQATQNTISSGSSNLKKEFYYDKKDFSGRGFGDQIDSSYLLNLINSPPATIEDRGSSSDSSSVLAEKVTVATAGVATKFCDFTEFHNGNPKEDDSDDESAGKKDSDSKMSSDSGSESDDDLNFEPNSYYDANDEFGEQDLYTMDDIQRAMDRELQSEDAFMNTFQDIVTQGKQFDPANMSDEDLDAHFLSNFLNAHSEGLGVQLGPFQQLLSQLGLESPLPPPVSSFETQE